MPICERDPWRFQYFENVACPDDVFIPTDDIDAWPWYPEYRWVYDKLKIAASQNLPCGPHGVEPPSYPVFSKPIINLKGMGLGSHIMNSSLEMQHHSAAGHFWMPLLQGEHISTDVAVVQGEAKWLCHAAGQPWLEGMFKHWVIESGQRAGLAQYLTDWIARLLPTYTGMLNFESIGGSIIEVHLRFADQWCDLYGRSWFDALVGLYAKGQWHLENTPQMPGYSVPLFARHGTVPKHPAPALQSRIRALPHISSLQITFHENKSGKDHPMPPGGFRLGLINCTNLEAGFAARRLLATGFPGCEMMIPSKID